MVEMNIEQARFNMVEQQIRPWDVLNPDVLNIIMTTPREDYVPAQYRSLAFVDTNIPLPHEQVMMAPVVEGRILQAVDIQHGDKVLEIGTGSGYLTACLAGLGSHVTSVDIFEDFTREAGEKLAAHGLDNVTLVTDDAAAGYGEAQAYDVIVITGALPEVPQAYREALAIGGRLCAIIGESPAREAVLITRLGEDQWQMESLFETDIPDLINVPRARNFDF